MRTALTWSVLMLLGAPTGAAELQVYAAASLTEALQQLGRSFEKQNPGHRIVFHFAASGELNAQIEEGAPADLFVPADLLEMERLVDAGLVEEPAVLTRGSLVLVVPAGDVETRSLEDLAWPEIGRVGLGAPETVPAGRYAVQALQKLGLWARVQPKVVYAQDVRQVLKQLQTGAVQAGLVYRSDARNDPRVRIVLMLPPDLHEHIVYPVAVLRRTSQGELARRFQRHLLSEPSRAVLAKLGFDSAYRAPVGPR